MSRRTAFRPRKIELHKALPIVRSMDDLYFVDDNGKVHRASRNAPGGTVVR